MEEYPLSIRQPKVRITDKKELTKYVWAFTLGDGCLRKDNHKNRPNKAENYHFECGQLAEHEDYILWRADILSNITSAYIQKKQRGDSKPMLITRVNRHPFFTTLRKRVYLDGRKVIDPHDLKLLDWETLAILYQDDGCLSKKNEGQNCYILTISTESFSYGDQVLLQRAIKNKTGILFRINSTRSADKSCLHYRLILGKYSLIKEFLAGIKPYIKDSFKYKLLPNV